MNPEYDLKELWQKQETKISESSIVINQANKLKRNNVRKLMLSKLLILVTIIIFGLILVLFPSDFLSTKIGISIMVLAMLIFIFHYNKLKPFLQSSAEVDSATYLKDLISLKEKQGQLQTTMLNIYFLLLSLGLALTLYEYLSKMKLIYAVLAYALVVVWIGFNWFYLRPKISKKDQANITRIIDKVKALQANLAEAGN